MAGLLLRYLLATPARSFSKTTLRLVIILVLCLLTITTLASLVLHLETSVILVPALFQTLARVNGLALTSQSPLTTLILQLPN